MKKREFNKTLKLITTKNMLDLNKIKNLTNEQRSGLCHFIIRSNGPLLVNLIPKDFDMSWLRCMGYMYYRRDEKTGFTFVCNGDALVSMRRVEK
jgi:hypothetical protein